VGSPRRPRGLVVAGAVLAAVGLAALAPGDGAAPGAPVEVTVHTPSGAHRSGLGLHTQEGWSQEVDWADGALRVRVRHPDVGSVPVRVDVHWGTEAELVPTVSVDDGQLTARRTPPRRSGLVVGLLAVVAVLWVSETFPLWVTSLAVPVVLVAGGATTPTAALQPFFDPVIALFFAAFALADAMAACGLDRRLANAVVGRTGHRPRRLFAGMLALSAVLSMFMSNTAAAALLVPLAMSVTAPLGPEGRGYRRALVLGIAYAATIGGVGSAIGTPANPLAIAMLARVGHPIGFLEWFAYGLPVVVLLLPVVGAWVWWRLGAGPAARPVPVTETMAPTWSVEERQVAGVFSLVLLGWLSDEVHGVHPGLVGMAGVVGLAALGRFDKQGLARMDWAALLTFGGGLSMGAALGATGTSDWLAVQLEGLSSLPGPVGVAAVAVCSLALTSVASNTASAAILVPLALPLASVLGVDPRLLVMVVAVASSVDFALVVGTPPTMVAYSTDQFTAAEVFRVGAVLDLIGLAVLLTVVVAWWGLMGLVQL